MKTYIVSVHTWFMGYPYKERRVVVADDANEAERIVAERYDEEKFEEVRDVKELDTTTKGIKL